MATLLYYSSSQAGGLADYAHEQANALTLAGVTVKMVTTAAHIRRADTKYEVCPVLAHSGGVRRSRLAQKVASVRCILQNFKALDRQIRSERHDVVLFSSYVEYLAPLWSGRFRSLANSGVVFGAVCHDPVRDFVIGPLWWHRRSIAAGYSFLREAFVHQEIQLETVRPMPRLRTTVIPHGPYKFPTPTRLRADVRKEWQVPDGATVALSFGHIRDGKNLDLILQVLPEFPSLYLVVAGKEQSSAQKPIAHYQELACKFGVQERCRWIHGHIPEEQVGNLFLGSDMVLLTYSRDFQSASGVLNAGAAYRKPCVASSGGGNLRAVVERYELGWFIEPDSVPALKAGIGAALQGGINPRWSAYEAENSWEENARLVKEKMFGYAA